MRFPRLTRKMELSIVGGEWARCFPIYARSPTQFTSTLSEFDVPISFAAITDTDLIASTGFVFT